MPISRRPPAVLACACVVGVTAVAGLASAVGATPSVKVNVRAAAKTILPRLESRSGVPIRIPATVYFSTRSRVYATGTASARAYDLELGFAPDCGGADACFAADFEGRRGSRVFGRESVRLAGGIVGRFTPSSCGGSCSPPQIQWIQGGVRYSLQLYGGRRGSDEDALVGYANSAIGDPPA
jgi:hypothetical protein